MVGNKAKQGAYCCTFEMVFKGDEKNIPEQPLINENGKKYGKISVANGKTIFALVLPSFIRENNEKPFTLRDSIRLKLIKSDCEKQLKYLLGTDIKSKLKFIEVNITQKDDSITIL